MKRIVSLSGDTISGILNNIALPPWFLCHTYTHSCRPHYLLLSSLRQEFPGVPLVAVTATATPAVIEEISGILALKQPKILIGSFNRPNITYSVRHKELIGDGSDTAALQVQMHSAACRKHTQFIVLYLPHTSFHWPDPSHVHNLVNSEHTLVVLS